MKKNVLLAGIIASIALSLGSFMSCSNEAGPQGGSSSTTYKASINNIEVFASYNGSTEGFRGTVSGSSITIDLPANIDSWTDSWICIYLDSGKLIQLNGTGTTYSGSSSEKITGVTLSSLNSILVKGSGYEDQSYTVKINKKLYVSYNKNYGYVPNWTSVVPSSTVLYSAGDKISLPAEEAERSKYRQLGWSSSTDAESPEYDVSGEITVTESMVNAGVLDLYVTWSKYHIGELLDKVTDVDGNIQTGYVAYICGKNDNVKAKSSKPNESWTYLIVSKYGTKRLTNVTWSNATFTDADAYLPTKTEMETIITNLWEGSSSQWKIFSDGSSNETGWTDYWTATEYDADDSKAYYASVTTNYNGSYAGNVVSTKDKTKTLKAIGVSYIK